MSSPITKPEGIMPPEEMLFYELLVKRYELNKKRGYKKFYMLIDLHDTVMVGSKSAEESLEFVSSYCKFALRGLSTMDDIVLIMWTSTWPQKWQDIIEPWLKQNEIYFKYFNENPECLSNKYSYFGYKFYFDIGLDDKFGFDVSHWNEVHEFVTYLQIAKEEDARNS